MRLVIVMHTAVVKKIMLSRFGGLSKLGSIPAGDVPAGPFKSASSSTRVCSGGEEAVVILLMGILRLAEAGKKKVL